MAHLDIRDVRKTYPGGFEAIKGVSCSVGDGEFLVLLGPSGCGKSTLLRMVAGLETISSGEIAIDERVVNKVEPKDRNIAMVFQNYALYPHMSVFDNMAYGLKIAGLPKAEIRARVEKAAGVLELSHLLERKPRALSGGQRQRVAMGRAIVRQPKVFLFDEPLSNLDAKLRTQMRVEIKKLQRELGVTSLYVTHDQVEAMTLADRVIVMNGGRAEQIGTPMEVYEKPASLFVAGFIGAPPMNVLPGVVAEGGAAIRLQGGPLLPFAAGHSGAGRALAVGVRPERIRIGEGEAGAPTLAAEVELIEALGADTLVYCRFEGGMVIARAPGAAKLREGERLPLAIDADALHLFDPETGRRLSA